MATFVRKCFRYAAHNEDLRTKGELVVLLSFTCNYVVYYANMSVHYTAIFHGCKNGNFQLKFFDYFHVFAQNIDCGYTLEPPQ